MSILRQCSFYRDPEDLYLVRSLGYYDFDKQTKCVGDIKFCKKPVVLMKYLLDQKRSEW